MLIFTSLMMEAPNDIYIQEIIKHICFYFIFLAYMCNQFH